MLDAQSLLAAPEFRPGSHFLWLYESEEEHRAVVTAYLRQGVERGEKIIYLAHSHTPAEISGYLRAAGIEPAPLIARKQLQIIARNDFVPPDGAFDPDAAVAGIARLEEQALAEGFPALRLSGEMTWALSVCADSLVEYEQKADGVLAGSRCLGLCQYDRRRFAPNLLLRLIALHPTVMEGMNCYANIYYTPNIEAVADDLPGAALRYWLDNLAIQKRASDALRESERRYRAIVEDQTELVCRFLPDGTMTFVNEAYCRCFGRSREEFIGVSFIPLLPEADRELFLRHLGSLCGEKPLAQIEHRVILPNGQVRWQQWTDRAIFDEAGRIVEYQSVGRDITKQKEAEDALQRAKDELEARVAERTADLRRASAEAAALLEAARSVLHHREFKEAARSIFTACKRLLGADAGYVDLLSKDGSQTLNVLVDPGSRPCNAALPARIPMRGMRAAATEKRRSTIFNDPASLALPPGHVQLNNLLFVPLELEGQVAGLMCMANKPGGFTQADARMAEAFGEFVAIALSNSRTLESLENSELRFRSVVETASDAVIAIDEQGKVIFWNKAAIGIYGYSAEEAIGQPFTFVVPERLREESRTDFQRLSMKAPETLGTVTEMIGLRKDGSEFPLELSLSSWRTAEGAFVTAIARDCTARKRAENDLLDYQRQLQSLASELSLTEESERRRIANELHDRIGQSLALAKIKLGELRKAMHTPPLAEQTSRIVQLIEQTIKDTRLLTVELSPPILYELGFPAAVEWLTEQIHEQHGIASEFEDDCLPKPLDDDIRVVLFQAARELLVNVVKHAHAGSVKVKLKRDGDRIIVRVEDDGIGFDAARPAEKHGEAGFGLFSVRERLGHLGGRVAIDSKEKAGTVVTLEAPLKTQKAQ
ncbi:MAG TPA: PAS domain S-box protein [Planctomycetota bacterium]|nr:PAS domain S-box protein [Planctomycetota bacterium]